MKSILTASLLLLAALAAAADPTIDGPDEVAAGKPAWFCVTGVPQSASATFMPTALLDTTPSRVVPGNAMFWVARPGEYVLSAIVVDWGAKTLTPLSKQVTVTGDQPGPEPKPDPKPEPKPDPKPVPKVAWGIIVEERSERTQLPVRQRYVFESTAVRGLFTEGKFLVVDRNSTDPGVKAYIDQAAKIGVPCLILADDQGNIAFQGPLPASVDETVKLIGGMK